MQRYRVEGGTLRIGQGAVVGLSEGQAGPRLSRMKKVGENLYRLSDVHEFKSGETIVVAYDDIPKHARGIVVCLDPAGPSPARPRKQAKSAA